MDEDPVYMIEGDWDGFIWNNSKNETVPNGTDSIAEPNEHE